MGRVDIRRLVYAVIAGLLWGLPTEVVYLMGGTEALVNLAWIHADAFIWPAVPAILGLVVAIVVYAILGWKPKAAGAVVGAGAVAPGEAQAVADADAAAAADSRSVASADADKDAADKARAAAGQSARTSASQKSRRFPWLNFAFGMKHVLVLAGVIFVCWLPVLILMYPCSINPDTTEQLFEFQTSAPTYYPWGNEYVDAEFVDHHPVFDTLLYGSITLLGDAIGSYNHAFFLYILLQSALGALGLAASCCYASRLAAPRAKSKMRFQRSSFVTKPVRRKWQWMFSWYSRTR